jgi:hypothetical protein
MNSTEVSSLAAHNTCLAIAAGLCRTTDLFKRTADAALIEIAGSLSASLTTSSADAATSSGPIDLATPASASSAAIVEFLTGGNYGYAFDVDSHLQRGPASTATVAAILELASKLSDPAIPRPPADRILGLHLVTAVFSAGGTALRSHPSIRRLLMRETSRGNLRAVGSFHEAPAYISAAFNAETPLVHCLGEDPSPCSLHYY